MRFKKILKEMKDYKIEKKLSTSFGAILVMFFASVFISIAGLMYISISFNNFYSYYYEVTTNTLDSRMAVQGAVKSVAITLLTNNPESVERFQNDAITYSERLAENLNTLQQIYRGDTSEIQEMINANEQANQYRQKLYDCVAADNKAKALSIYMNDYGPAMTVVQTKMQQLDTTASGLAAKAFHNSQIVNGVALILAIVVSVVSLLMTFTLSKNLIAIMKKPIEEIEAAAKEMAAGSLNVNINYESEDEFGSLADSMRLLCGNVGEIVADVDCVLEQLASGDFRVDSKAEGKYIGDYQPILVSMYAIRDKLNDAMKQINESSEMVAEGSLQLAESAQSLAEGSMEQSSAVEELTATVEDVSNMAETNAKEAEVAYRKVAEAEKEADKSQQSLYDLTEAMEVINETSMKIQNIITAIEDIASQTNLLSLNASIEAARAGEAGRGFAVVADQIGKLAADSARSAVDTKGLLVESMEQVRNGSAITEKTVEAIKSVLDSMREFEEISKHTSDTSRKQADMLGQIQQGIEQISMIVQSNSAAAEETSATSEELSAQADHLKQEVNKFQLR